MTHDDYLMYKELRQEGLIGKLWCDGEYCRLAPLDALPGLEWQLAEVVPEGKLIEHILSLYIRYVKLPTKIPPQSSSQSQAPTKVVEPFLFGKKLA